MEISTKHITSTLGILTSIGLLWGGLTIADDNWNQSNSVIINQAAIVEVTRTVREMRIESWNDTLIDLQAREELGVNLNEWEIRQKLSLIKKLEKEDG